MLPKKVKKRASLLAVFLSASVLGVFLILNAETKIFYILTLQQILKIIKILILIKKLE